MTDASARARSVLVVEDEPEVAADIERLLRDHQFEVLAKVASGEEALDLYPTIRPALVLMDVNLAGALDGVETARRLRESYGAGIVFLTSSSDALTIERAKEAEPLGYLVKPYDGRELRTALEIALHKHGLEQHLANRERWFATTLRSIGDAVIATDGEGRVTFLNAIAERLTGWTAAEALGRELGSVMRVVDAEGHPVRSAIAVAMERGFRADVPGHAHLVSRSGERLPIDDRASLIVDEGGRVLGGVVVFRDVSDERRREEALATAARLASIGTVAAGVAHEINNPLQTVVLNVTCALDAVRATSSEPKAREIVEMLEDALGGVEKARGIVGELNRFARREVGPRRLVDLPTLVREVVAALGAGAAKVSTRFESTPFVEASPIELRQAVSNVVANAVQAAGRGSRGRGSVSITTRTDRGGRAEIAVRDDGPGIPPALRSRIFDPFFTTQPTGQGTGLGLPVAHSIVRDLGGDISIESAPGEGTTVRIALPPAAGRYVRVPSEPPPPPKPRRRRRVLLIDDDEMLLRAVLRALRDECEAVGDSDPRAALHRLASDAEFDLVLCDLNMPQMNGIDVLRALSTVNRALSERFVLMTGRSDVQPADVAARVIHKPFSMASVRALLDEIVPD